MKSTGSRTNRSRRRGRHPRKIALGVLLMGMSVTLTGCLSLLQIGAILSGLGAIFGIASSVMSTVSNPGGQPQPIPVAPPGATIPGVPKAGTDTVPDAVQQNLRRTLGNLITNNELTEAIKNQFIAQIPSLIPNTSAAQANALAEPLLREKCQSLVSSGGRCTLGAPFNTAPPTTDPRAGQINVGPVPGPKQDQDEQRQAIIAERQQRLAQVRPSIEAALTSMTQNAGLAGRFGPQFQTIEAKVRESMTSLNPSGVNSASGVLGQIRSGDRQGLEGPQQVALDSAIQHATEAIDQTLAVFGA